MKLFWIALLLPILANAEIFRWQDSKGRFSFSDRPQAGSQLIEVKPGYAFHFVEHVYDGDTVLLDNGQKVRLLGINTPEVEGRYKLAEPGGNEAKIWLEKRLSGKKVRLETDSDKKDKYGRTLAHIFTEDHSHVNVELVKRGLAWVSIHPPNLKYVQELGSAQKQAEMGRKGVWKLKEYQSKPINSILTGNYKGWKRLTGVVKKLHDSRKYSYLKFSDQIDARIDHRFLDLFPELREYLNRKVEIRGWPTRRKDHYSIFIRHPMDIKLIQ